MECQNLSLSHLPAEIQGEILSFSDFETLKECESVCKLWNESIKERGEKYREEKEIFFTKELVPSLRLIPKSIIDAIGGNKALCLLPKLDLGENTGRTGYLDFITPEMMSAPIMRGVDKCERPFISFKVCAKADGDSFLEAFTLFSRYTVSVQFRCCPFHPSFNEFGGSSGIAEENIKNIQKLVQGEAFPWAIRSRCLSGNYSVSLAKEPAINH